jgi:sulfotransferase family protein/aspartyl/asparaginyl beta-hydroxylase
MRLLKPFFRLPMRLDVARLRAEVSALPVSAWAPHPNHIEGNSSVRLISADGAENDDVNGVMLPTPHLEAMPYVRQILASFGVVWSRSRLLRLAPGAVVPEHADINYHWFTRVRLHIPIITRPEVRFFCGDQVVHMAAGEVWVFDNWRLHRVENPTPDERIHLVADTSGSAAFWQLVAQSDLPDIRARDLPYDPARAARLLTERTVLAPVMTPGEVDFLVQDLRAELTAGSDSPEARTRLARYHSLLDSVCRDWRQLYAMHGANPDGWADFIKVRDHLRNTSRSISEGLFVRTNRVGAHAVLEGRVLRAMLSVAGDSTPTAGMRAPIPRSGAAVANVLRRPVFIIAAPRSGSTLLFETLAVSHDVATIGGEGHLLIESMPELQPGAPGIESNRLIASHATDDIAARVRAQILAQLQDARGQRVPPDAALRFLEKTPKNALRIPFFNHLFPDARFIVLWRDPCENLGSIIDAWRSGNWKTYNGLDGFDGPWSLLLPPGWRALNGRPLEEIAATQWDTTNRIILDDLAWLPGERWTVVQYADLLSTPADTVRRLCAFMDVPFDDALAQRAASPLPHARYTLTAPDPQKWRRHEAAITRVLPTLDTTLQRLRELRSSSR